MHDLILRRWRYWVSTAGVCSGLLMSTWFFVNDLCQVTALTAKTYGTVSSREGDDLSIAFVIKSQGTVTFVTNDTFYQIGDRVPVRYDPRKPQNARIADIFDMAAISIFTLVSSIGFLIVLPGVLHSYYGLPLPKIFGRSPYPAESSKQHLDDA
jgi:hypothetical protein